MRGILAVAVSPKIGSQPSRGGGAGGRSGCCSPAFSSPGHGPIFQKTVLSFGDGTRSSSNLRSLADAVSAGRGGADCSSTCVAAGIREAEALSPGCETTTAGVEAEAVCMGSEAVAMGAAVGTATADWVALLATGDLAGDLGAGLLACGGTSCSLVGKSDDRLSDFRALLWTSDGGRTACTLGAILRKR